MLYSRRSVLAGLGAIGTAALTPPRHAFARIDDRPFFFFTDDEARFLALICDTLIPEDEFPSASQAGVVDYIDLQMAGPYGRGARLYMQPPFAEGTASQGYQLPLVPAQLIRQGLADLADRDDGALRRDAAARKAALTQLSAGDPAALQGHGSTFFDELWKLTNEGFFADPIHGGNADYAGWNMVGFPGAHAYYQSFVDKFNVPYPKPPMGINHKPGGDGAMPRPLRQREG